MTARSLLAPVLLAALVTIGCEAFAQVPAAAPAPPPAGPGLGSILEHCGGCHSTTTVFGQRRSREDWEATVQLMVDRGADLSADDQGVVIDYLAKNYNTAPVVPAK